MTVPESINVAGAGRHGTVGAPTGTRVSEAVHAVVSRVDPAPSDGMAPIVVKVTVDAAGSVRGARVVSTPSSSDGDAIGAARQWLFAPSDGAWTTYIGFSLVGRAPGRPPIAIGGTIRPPKKILDVKPVYPDEAQQTGIQGVQIVEAIIDEEGTVSDAWVLHGQDALIPSALGAVLRWKFEPALLNGDPVPLRMTVTVNFTLSDSAAAPAMVPAAPASLPPSWPSDAIRVGGNVRPPTKTVDVKAVYPPSAIEARVQGVVICEVLIGSDGKVADAFVLRSIPLLDQAALDAVRQWEFVPTLLNGHPVPVAMTVTVNFTLE